MQSYPSLSKKELETVLRADIAALGFTIVEADFEKPWGGFFRLDDAQAASFVEKYFDGQVLPAFTKDAPLSPKFLVVEPGMKLSWQVHERRSEVWRVIDGPVGVSLSETDIQPAQPSILQSDDMITIPVGTRHRLIGLGNRGLIAEIWVHTDSNNFSNETDIRRIEDDFGR